VLLCILFKQKKVVAVPYLFSCILSRQPFSKSQKTSAASISPSYGARTMEGTKRVMIVDDDENSRRVIQAFLESLANSLLPGTDLKLLKWSRQKSILSSWMWSCPE
jgi:hypothetical protein